MCDHRAKAWGKRDQYQLRRQIGFKFYQAMGFVLLLFVFVNSAIYYHHNKLRSTRA